MESETIRFSPPPRVVGTILHTAPHFGQLFTQNTQKSGKNHKKNKLNVFH